jgi:hypothetical protein
MCFIQENVADMAQGLLTLSCSCFFLVLLLFRRLGAFFLDIISSEAAS